MIYLKLSMVNVIVNSNENKWTCTMFFYKFMGKSKRDIFAKRTNLA